MKCKICNKSYKQVGSHIKQHQITSEEYYCKYLKKDDTESQCKLCGVKTEYLDSNIGYRKYCSRKCQVSDPKRVIKIKQTKLEKYGDENYNNIEKNKQTCLNRYGVEYSTQISQMKENSKKTLLRKYGVDNASKSDYIKEKKKHTMLNNYGVEYPLQIPEVRKSLRLSAISRIEQNKLNGNQLNPNYNPEACKIIDEYGKKHGYNFQHAENGGEHHIKELGYFVDGYDKEKNVAIEYYEKAHKNQKERDKKRKQEIIDKLDCEFIELKEWELND